MNRDRDRFVALPAPGTSGLAQPDRWRRRSLEVSRVFMSQVRQRTPQIQQRVTQVRRQWPMVMTHIRTQIQNQLPKLQTTLEHQRHQMPARIHSLRYAHKQKSGKVLVRGLIGISGALGCLDWVLVDRLWF